ncbi:hypothetical protein ACOMHD_12520 [Xanthomonas codiaei]|uniref:Uncharacterized protein n=3 Tax=Xanthomonas codiaei TaxID=56463 RepID=A0A2S7CXU4_9XANT|nr:hypothetical protein [Xanthomonas codiaei]PPU66396.1 hypothetical protein XcodCFBP4690_02440 [Xanthomonas codiaei]
MSQHAIEELIERCIHLVDASAVKNSRKAALMHALLRLQARYDTGVTWLRMHTVLLRHGVLVRSLADDMDNTALRAEALAADAPGWLHHAHGPAYLEWEGDTRVVYHLSEPATDVPLADLFCEVLTLADQAGDGALFVDGYGLLVNGWLDETFDANDGIAATLDGLLASDALQSIRALAARQGLKRRRNAPEDLALPRLDDSGTADDIERAVGLRFFLQPKRTPAALRAARAKAQRQQARVYEVLPQLIDRHLGTSLRAAGWSPVAVAAPLQWHWIRDLDGSRQHLWASYDASLGELMLQVGMQHARLLAWQQRVPTTHLHDLHVVDGAAPFLGEDLLRSADIGNYGGWVVNPASSDATLEAGLDRLAAALPALDASYFGRIAAQLAGPWFERPADAWLQVLEAGDDTGAVPPTVLFASPDSLLLAFVFFHLEAGETARADALVQQLRARLDARPRPSAWHRLALAPFLQQWEQGARSMPMPAVLHPLLLGHLRAQEGS